MGWRGCEVCTMSDILEVATESVSALDEALARIGALADSADAEPEPEFPYSALAELERAGVMAFNAVDGPERPPAADELALVRSVARADGSVGRIFDGHLNAVERIAVQGPEDLRATELRAVAAGELWAGVWGGDPAPGEGSPATVVRDGAREVLRGVKTFCSGAGGLHRALVLGRDPEGGPPISVWIDVSDADRAVVDPSWYRSAGLRASVSHRVVFDDAPVLARLGPSGGIAEQPWFGRDALRTAASWAGMADSAVESALDELARRPTRDSLQALAAGRILTAQGTISVWMQTAAQAMDEPERDLPAVALHARVAISDACRTLIDEAARACGSRPFARGGQLDRARRDLEVFLLQHRLDPLLARAGGAELDRRET
jgi:alkylation response protein AidB-like acyl-CoA dehydrogenase